MLVIFLNYSQTSNWNIKPSINLIQTYQMENILLLQLFDHSSTTTCVRSVTTYNCKYNTSVVLHITYFLARKKHKTT